MNLLPGFTTHLLRLTKSLSAFAYLIAKTARLAMPCARSSLTLLAQTARLAMPSARSSLTLLLPSIVGAFACQNFTLGHAMRKIIPHSMLPSIVGAFTYYLFAKTARLAMPCARSPLTLLLPSMPLCFLLHRLRHVAPLLFQRHCLGAPNLPTTSQAMSPVTSVVPSRARIPLRQG